MSNSTYIQIYKLLLYFLLTLAMITNGQSALYIILVVTIIMLILYINQPKKKIYNKTIYTNIVFQIVLVLVEYFRFKNTISFYQWDNSIFRFYGVIFCLLLVPPLYEVICEDKDIFLRNLNRLGLIVLFVRVMSWYIYNTRGLDIGFTFLQGRPEWVKSMAGIPLIRMPGMFLEGFLLCYSVAFLLKSKGKIKVAYFIEILFLFFYEWVVFQSRGYLIIYTLVIYITFIYYLIHNRKIIACISILVLGIFLLSLFHNMIFSSFSTTGTYAVSTNTRILEYSYFPELWNRSSIIWGFGLTPDTLEGIVTISDMNFIINLYQFGIIGLLIRISPFVVGFIILLKYKKEKIFFLAFNLFCLFFSIFFNPYMYMTIFLLPLYLSYSMYVEYK